jgi:hypothetical protein
METEWQIDFNGWIIKTMANGYPQAKYRAWKQFNNVFGSITFRDFVVNARIA